MPVLSGQPIEFAENIAALVFRNARPAVADLDADEASAMAAADDHPARRGVAHRIGRKVENDPFQQDDVAAHPDAARYDPERQALFARRAGKRALDSLED